MQMRGGGFLRDGEERSRLLDDGPEVAPLIL
jgi:hypothetical protein